MSIMLKERWYFRHVWSSLGCIFTQWSLEYAHQLLLLPLSTETISSFVVPRFSSIKKSLGSIFSILW